MRLSSLIRHEIQVIQERVDYIRWIKSDRTSRMYEDLYKQMKDFYQHEMNSYKLRAENLYSDIDETYSRGCKEQLRCLGSLKI